MIGDTTGNTTVSLRFLRRSIRLLDSITSRAILVASVRVLRGATMGAKIVNGATVQDFRDQLYSLTEAAEVLGVNRATIYRWITEQGMPAYATPTKRTYVPRRLIDAILSEGRPKDKYEWRDFFERQKTVRG
jgi:excisionase family DNA binding protein